MSATNLVPWESLKKWSGAAFIVAGVSRFANSALANLPEVTAMTSPGWALDLTLVLAFGAAFIGLFGLYPRLIERTPKLSRAGLVVVAIGAVAVTGILISLVAFGGETPPGPLALLPMLVLGFSTLGFLLFGVASLRTSIPSRTVGILLLVASATTIGFIVGLTFIHSHMLARIDTWVYAGTLLAIGYLLQTRHAPTDRANPAADSAA